MKPVEFEHQTLLLAPPPGTPRGECGALPVLIHDRGTPQQIFTPFWKPSPEDLAKLNAGEHLRLDVWSIHPPVWISVERCAELP